MKRAFSIIAILFLIDFGLKVYVHYTIPIGVSKLIFARNIFFTNIDGEYIESINRGFYSLIMILNFILLIILTNMMPTIDFRAPSKKLYSYAVSIYMAGIVGNISDRFFSSYATEYIHIRVFGVTLPMFNLSTLYVIAGVILIAIDLIRDRRITNEIKHSKYYVQKQIKASQSKFNRLTSRGGR